jgi:hypothetical protein
LGGFPQYRFPISQRAKIYQWVEEDLHASWFASEKISNLYT